jgi:CBS domain containing-hemolysin-like protein
MPWLLVAAIGLLVANGFFVAVEFALIASRRTKLEPRAEQGQLRARLGLSAVRQLSLQLAGAQLGITMASLGLGAVAEPAVARLIERAVEGIADLPCGVVHSVSFAIALTIVVFLHMVIGEMVPKNIAIADPERTLLWLAIPNKIYMTVFGPLIRLLNGLANSGTRAFGVEPRDEVATAHTADEFAQMLAASREEGLIEETAHDLLTGALDFGDRPVEAVAVPLGSVVTAPRQATVEEAERLVVQSGHSRLPVTGASATEIVGFMHVKDLLTILPAARNRPLPVSRIRPLLRVPAELPLDEVLVQMRRSRIHLAVVERDGEPIGIASLEDVLEDLVGDITDETDPGSRRVTPRRRPVSPRRQ